MDQKTGKSKWIPVAIGLTLVGLIWSTFEIVSQSNIPAAETSSSSISQSVDSSSSDNIFSPQGVDSVNAPASKMGASCQASIGALTIPYLN